MNRRGFGFVATPLGDIYIGKRETGGAMHGDTVAVRLDPRKTREGRAGTVAQVLERAVTELVGRFERHGKLGIVVPTDPRIKGDLFVDLATSSVEAKPGEIVVARITRYADRRDAMQGHHRRRSSAPRTRPAWTWRSSSTSTGWRPSSRRR